MKIISEQLIRSLDISPKICVEWIKESFAMKQDAQLPAKISVHPNDGEFFTSMPCLLPPPIHYSSQTYKAVFRCKSCPQVAQRRPELRE